MANPTWPASLPTPLATSSSAMAPMEDVIKSSVDAGPPKYRRRFTGTPANFTCSVLLTETQVSTLESFYLTTLNSVGLFDWTDFTTGGTVTYGFVKRPSYQHVPNTGSTSRLWTASLELERQP